MYYRTRGPLLVLTAALATLAIGLAAAPAHADGDAPPVVADPDAGAINTDVGGSTTSPGRPTGNGPESGGQPSGDGGAPPATPLCEQQPAVTCTNITTRDGAPQPEIIGPAGDPGIVLAYRARNQLRLPTPKAAFNPMIRFPKAGLNGTVVGFETWYWLQNAPGTLTQRTGNAQFWATVQATPVDVVFYPGDGARAVSCKGPGTKPPANLKDPAKASPTCGHRYEQSSGGRSGGSFTLQVATMWRVTWNAWDGTSGQLPLMVTQDSTPIAVGEAQAINQ